ncbi:hypothetical protein B296_00027497 [Ensete ventricosum]|uniref:Uncharacterized protein n=1 Tax=Ensete ventricosum TaxID=4639 RepID=A0A426YBZ5_ENSVE|nr:hypothetical protein B296_00027497 [Ensete ventricosum]
MAGVHVAGTAAPVVDNALRTWSVVARGVLVSPSVSPRTKAPTDEPPKEWSQSAFGGREMERRSVFSGRAQRVPSLALPLSSYRSGVRHLGVVFFAAVAVRESDGQKGSVPR